MQYKPNFGKTIARGVGGTVYDRYPIHTHFISVGEDLPALVRRYVGPDWHPGDFVSISEKIVSLCEKNILYKKDLQITCLAKFLARFASQSDRGIGVNNVYKMQAAIQLKGRAKILWAAVCGGVGKLFGVPGLFYRVAGPEISGMDGFYGKMFSDYGEFGILLPRHPGDTCRRIEEETGIPCMIVDANDFGVEILGSSGIGLPEETLCEIIRDNPANNGDELTPFVLIRPQTVKNAGHCVV